MQPSTFPHDFAMLILKLFIDYQGKKVVFGAFCKYVQKRSGVFIKISYLKIARKHFWHVFFF